MNEAFLLTRTPGSVPSTSSAPMSVAAAAPLRMGPTAMAAAAAAAVTTGVSAGFTLQPKRPAAASAPAATVPTTPTSPTSPAADAATPPPAASPTASPEPGACGGGDGDDVSMSSSTTPAAAILGDDPSLPYRLRILGVAAHGAKSRVETQIKLVIQLVHRDSDALVTRFRTLRVPDALIASDRWLRVANKPDDDTDAMDATVDPEAVVVLHGTVVRGSDPTAVVTACAGCVKRETKRMQRKKTTPAAAPPTGPTAPPSPPPSVGGSPRGLAATPSVPPLTDDSPTPSADLMMSERKILLVNAPPDLDVSTGDVALPIRIPCYCRHHKEKVGFIVKFEIRDTNGARLACAQTPPINITDDHKSVNKAKRQQELARRQEMQQQQQFHHQLLHQHAAAASGGSGMAEMFLAQLQNPQLAQMNFFNFAAAAAAAAAAAGVMPLGAPGMPPTTTAGTMPLMPPPLAAPTAPTSLKRDRDQVDDSVMIEASLLGNAMYLGATTTQPPTTSAPAAVNPLGMSSFLDVAGNAPSTTAASPAGMADPLAHLGLGMNAMPLFDASILQHLNASASPPPPPALGDDPVRKRPRTESAHPSPMVQDVPMTPTSMAAAAVASPPAQVFSFGTPPTLAVHSLAPNAGPATSPPPPQPPVTTMPAVSAPAAQQPLGNDLIAGLLGGARIFAPNGSGMDAATLLQLAAAQQQQQQQQQQQRQPAPAAVKSPGPATHMLSLGKGVAGTPLVAQLPKIDRVIPAEGPVHGGIEVTVLGSGFNESLTVQFGDALATSTTYWSPNTLVCVLPPAAQPGTVPVTIKQVHDLGLSTGQETVTFTYRDESDRALLELALTLIGLNLNGNVDNPHSIASRIVATYSSFAPNVTASAAAGTSSSSGTMHTASSPRIDMANLAQRLGLVSSEPLEDRMMRAMAVLVAISQTRGGSSRATIPVELTAQLGATRHPITGQSLLHLAARLRMPRLVAWLVHVAQVDRHARDKCRMTALDVAQLVRWPAGAALLLANAVEPTGADAETAVVALPPPMHVVPRPAPVAPKVDPPTLRHRPAPYVFGGVDASAVVRSASPPPPPFKVKAITPPPSPPLTGIDPWRAKAREAMDEARAAFQRRIRPPGASLTGLHIHAKLEQFAGHPFSAIFVRLAAVAVLLLVVRAQLAAHPDLAALRGAVRDQLPAWEFPALEFDAATGVRVAGTAVPVPPPPPVDGKEERPVSRGDAPHRARWRQEVEHLWAGDGAVGAAGGRADAEDIWEMGRAWRFAVS
ncbi:SPT3 Dosage dependent suppressor of Ty-induced promoter mutations-like protein [Allomyces arbusculus]|nr:SPT3 Dosage dependent suppressor of Ty-induced promoter mutations-like protein [Allomyces arbusculus]